MIYFVTRQQFIETEDIKQCTLDTALEWLNKLDEIEVDTETTGLDPYTKKILSIQLGNYINQYFISWEDLTTEEKLKIKNLLEDSNKLYILQNAKFDLRFFYIAEINLTNIYDTFLAECILTTGYKDAERDLSLKGLANKYLNVDLDKTIRGKIHTEGLSNRVVIYGANDVKYLSKIKEKQLPLLEKYGLMNVLKLENEVVKVFAKIENNGVRLDIESWMEVAEIVEKECNTLEKRMDEYIYIRGTNKDNYPNKLTKYCNIYTQGNLFFNDDQRKTHINWKSNSQKLSLLKDLGLPMTSVGERELQRVKYKNELIPILLSYTKHSKLAVAFGKNFLKFVNPVTNRIHYNIWQILSTGRISVSEPNLNQIPSHGNTAKKIRSSFIPKEGYKIVGGDYGQFELRIIAEYSQDKTWIETFQKGEDLHSKLCSMTFNIPVECIKDPFPPKPDFTYRDVQKTINFGLSYGMSEFKLADTIQIDVKEARKLIKKFFDVVPSVKNFLTRLGTLGTTRGYIKTGRPYRRIRWFSQWNTAIETQDFKTLGAIERASKNTPIQGTNGDIIKRALCLVQDEIDKNNYPVNILLTVYDEIQTECEESFAEKWSKIMEFLMKQAAEESIKSVPIVVDCGVSDHWTK